MFSRRQMLQLCTLGATGYFGSKIPILAQSSFPQAPTLEVQRANGWVEGQITAKASRQTIGGKSVQVLSYGSFPGPTIRVREGETLRLKFNNQLSEVTNLHFHGLRVSPKIDDPLAEVQPGESHVYEFNLPKGSAGTYWYHPHVHGKVAEQLYAGLAGMLIVEGPLDAIDELKQAEEYTLVFKDWLFRGEQIPAWNMMDWMNGREGNLLTVNGAIRPNLRPQKPNLRLRLLNASNARYYRLALENHPLYLIATDGGMIEKPLELTELLLAPGERAEVLVRLNRSGSYKMQALPYDRGAMGMQGMGGMGMNHGGQMGQSMQGAMPSMGETRLETLLTLVAPANPKPLALPSALATLERLDPTKAVATRQLVLGERMMQGEFFINEQMFDMHRIDIRAKLGTLEMWEVSNKTDMDHPFHLHTYPFQVLAHNGQPSAYRAWKDTVNLKKNDTLQLAIPLRDFTGITVYHCHILEHEDRGMMGVLQVEG